MTNRLCVATPWCFRISRLPLPALMGPNQQVSFLPDRLEIHWLSIINILILVVLLTAFLAMILLRIVKNDFSRSVSSCFRVFMLAFVGCFLVALVVFFVPLLFPPHSHLACACCVCPCFLWH